MQHPVSTGPTATALWAVRSIGVIAGVVALTLLVLAVHTVVFVDLVPQMR